MAKMELNRQEEYLNRIDRLKLMDDDFFSEALDGKIEAVEFILQVVLERDDLKVIETKAQVEYKSATKRSIRLDIKAVDRENERFNLEIQRASAGADCSSSCYQTPNNIFLLSLDLRLTTDVQNSKAESLSQGEPHLQQEPRYQEYPRC